VGPPSRTRFGATTREAPFARLAEPKLTPKRRLAWAKDGGEGGSAFAHALRRDHPEPSFACLWFACL